MGGAGNGGVRSGHENQQAALGRRHLARRLTARCKAGELVGHQRRGLKALSRCASPPRATQTPRSATRHGFGRSPPRAASGNIHCRRRAGQRTRGFPRPPCSTRSSTERWFRRPTSPRRAVLDHPLPAGSAAAISDASLTPTTLTVVCSPTSLFVDTDGPAAATRLAVSRRQRVLLSRLVIRELTRRAAERNSLNESVKRAYTDCGTDVPAVSAPRIGGQGGAARFAPDGLTGGRGRRARVGPRPLPGGAGAKIRCLRAPSATTRS